MVQGQRRTIYADNKDQVKYQLIVQLNKEQFNDQFNVKTKNTARPDLYEVVKYTTKQIATVNPRMPMYAVHQYFLNTEDKLRKEEKRT